MGCLPHAEPCWLTFALWFCAFVGVGVIAAMWFTSGRWTSLIRSRGELLLDRAISGEVKMTLVVRKDLKMGTGKIAAQCAHAAVAVVEELQSSESDVWRRWYGAWRVSGSQKVVLQCPDEQQLLDVAKVARSEGLPCYVIRDAGRTQIAPGSKTVVAVGPAPVDMVNRITGHLKLL